MSGRSWLAVSVRIPSEELVDELAEGLLALGGAAVREDGGRLTTYVARPPDVERFVSDARAALTGVAGGRELSVEWALRDDEDWLARWKEGLAPRRIGARLVVAPTWTEPELRSGDLPIRLDPEMAFGTGEHESTRGVLRLLEGALRPGDRVLDVGTGSGILAIAAALLGASEVLAVDSDPDAIPSARSNVERNGVAGRVEVREDTVTEGFLGERPASYDLIAANVLSGVLEPLLESFRGALRSAGDPLLLGGLLVSEADRITEAAVSSGFRLGREDREGEWWSVELRAC